MPSYDFGTQSVPSFPVSSSISRARVPPAIQTKHYPASRARSPLPSSSGHVQRPSTADSTTGAFPALGLASGKDSHLRAFDVARSRSPSPRPDAQHQQQQPTTSSHLLENGLRKLRSIGRSKDKDKEKDRDRERERERERDRSYRYAEPFNPTASAPAMALSFGSRSRTPPHTVTSFTAIRPSTPPSSNLRAPPHTAAAGSSFRPQHGPSSSLAMPPGARSADPFSASFTDAVRTDPFAARDHLARTRRNSLRESGAPQPRSGPAPTKITTSSSHGGSRRPDKGKAPAYVPSNASTASLSDAAPPPARPPPMQEPRPVVQQQATPPRQQQQQATPPKQAKSGHQKSASSGVFAGFAASGMGMGLPPTAAFAAPRVKPRTNRSVTDTSIPSSHARSISQQAPDAAFVYGLGGGSGFHFSVARTSSREGTPRNKDHAPKPLPPVPGSAPASAVEPAPQPVVEISHAAAERRALSPKGKTPLTPAFVGMTASPSFKTNALPRQDDSMLSPMTAGGPTSAGTPLSGASALSVWEDSPLGPPPSLADPLSPGAQKPEPVRPAVRSRWAPRSDAGSDDELRSALESVLSPDTGVSAAAQPAAKSKTAAAARPKARRRASSLDSHYRLATPARTRFYDPPAMFTPPATSAFVNPDADAPRSAKSRSFVIASPRDNEARDFVNAMLRGDVKLDPSLMDPRDSKVPPWAHHNRGLSIDTNLGLGVGRPPSRPPRAAPAKVEAPPPAAAAVELPILDLEAPALEQPEPALQEKKARPKTRTVTTLWTELWQDVHSAQFASPASPDVPPLPTSLATAPTHAHTHALPAAAPSRSSTLGSAPPNQARNSTLSTLSSVPSLSAFPMPPSPPPAVPPIPAAAVLAAKHHQHHPRATQGPGGALASPALPSLNFGSPLSVSFGDSPRSLFSAASGPHDFLSPARSSSSGLASSMFASSPASLRSVGSGAADMLAAPAVVHGEHHGSKRAPSAAE